MANDLTLLGALILASLLLGLASNPWRIEPLPTPLTAPYRSKAERLLLATQALPKALPSQPPSMPLDPAGDHATPPQDAPLPTLPLSEVQAIAEGRAPGIIIDARPAAFYRLGHIPHALNLSRKTFPADYETHRPRIEQARDGVIVVYCSGEECEDSHLVGDALRRIGFPRIHLYEGGWSEWTDNHSPAEPSQP